MSIYTKTRINILRISALQASKFYQHFRHVTNAIRLKDGAHGPGMALWNKAIRDAEKIVEYQHFPVKLRGLMGDKALNLAAKLNKLVERDHTGLLKTSKDLFYSKHNNHRPWGLITLLLSKSVSCNGQQARLVKNKVGEVLQTQNTLAEITEMLLTANLFHKGLVNVPRGNRNATQEAIITENKLGLLVGDCLFATASGMVARIMNQDLVLLVCSACRDLTEAEFLGDRDCQNFPVPAAPFQNVPIPIIDHESRTDAETLCINNVLGNAKEEWTVLHTLSGGSLLGRSCQGAMLLAKQPRDLQKRAYALGCHLALAWQASYDLYKLNCKDSEYFSLISAPVLYALQCDRGIYSKFIEPFRGDISHVDYGGLREAIKQTTALEKSRTLLEEHSTKSRDILKTMGNNTAISAIRDIISAMLFKTI